MSSPLSRPSFLSLSPVGSAFLQSPRCVTPPGDLFFLLEKALLSFIGMTVDSHATNARQAEKYLFYSGVIPRLVVKSEYLF